MLITVSGIVGSGKSTSAKEVLHVLEGFGLNPRYRRFRMLTAFGFGDKTSRTESNEKAPANATAAPRRRDFTVRKLTTPRAVGYAARAVAFRLSRIGRSTRCEVLDRYFYDNFIHYQLTSRRERLYARVLRQLIPTPDLAFLLTASDETICRRRPDYAREYVLAAGRRYEAIGELFPNLVRVRTDAETTAQEEIRRITAALVNRPGSGRGHSAACVPQ